MMIRGLRWWIVSLVFLAAVLNYVDRQALSALAPTIQADLEMDDRDYANVVNVFLLAYTFAYLVSGRLVDRLGTRAGMALFVVWWSVANMLTAGSQGVRSLGATRFLLGLGEAGIWPAASKVVSEWFSPRERALAIGFYTMGSTVGATLAPLLVIPLAGAVGGEGWRVAFLITGFVGFLWLVPWLLLNRGQEDEKGGAAEGVAPSLGKAWSWGELVAFRPLWLLLAGRLLTDPVWYFFQFWFAKYLGSARGLDQESLSVTGFVFAAAAVGSLAGGWLSGHLVKRGMRPVAARLRVMLGCACLMPLAPLIAAAGGLPLALVLAGCTVFAALAWLINLTAIVVDVVPGHSLGTAFSIVAAGSTVGGMAMNLLVAAMVAGSPGADAGFLDRAFHAALGPLAALVEGRGYGAWFLVMAFLHPFAFLLLWLGGIRRARS